MMTLSCHAPASACASNCTLPAPLRGRIVAGTLRFPEVEEIENAAACSCGPESVKRSSQRVAAPDEIIRSLQLRRGAALEDDAALGAAEIVTLLLMLPAVATMLAEVRLLDDVNGKVAPAKLCEITRAAGIVTPAFEDFRLTVTEFAVGAVKLTLQVPEAPGTTARGEQSNCAIAEASGERAIASEVELLADAARRLAWRTFLTVPALIAKATVFEPPGTVTEEGAVMRDPSPVVERETATPVPAAGFEMLTVHWVLILGVSVVLAHCKVIALDAVTDIVTDELLPPSDAVRVAL